MALVRVGVALGPHGVRGDLKLSYTTDRPEALSPGGHYLLWDPLTNEAVTMCCAAVRTLPDAFLMRFEGLDFPEALKPFKGWNLMHCAQRGALPREAGEVYLFELKGLEVRGADGAAFARVTDVLDNGAQVLLELDLPGQPYVPYVSQHVPEVNLEQGYLVCTYPITAPREPREPRVPREPRPRRRRQGRSQ